MAIGVPPGQKRDAAGLDRCAASKCESIDAIIRADEKAFRCGNQGLEMSKPSERCAWRCDEQLSRIAAKTVEAIVAFRAKDPDNWICAAIRVVVAIGDPRPQMLPPTQSSCWEVRPIEFLKQ